MMPDKIKKIKLLCIALLLVGTAAMAQRKDDQRTLATKIADLLAEMPAKDAKQLDFTMKEIAAMGKEGLVEMAGMLVAPGNGDNTSLEYALGGFSFYVMQTAREDLRKLSTSAYCQALGTAQHDEVRSFLITQLQVVGKDDAVACLQSQLSKNRLCDPAARALVSINSPSSKEALLQALPASQAGCRLALVEALGDTRYAAAVPAITPLVSSSDEKLRKLALYALANTADPASEAVLAAAARKASYTYSNDNATAAYVLYAKRLTTSGKLQQAEKVSQELLDNAVHDNQVHTRTTALSLLTAIHGEKNMPLLAEAAGSQNMEYRAAALKLALPHMTPAHTALWVKKQKKADAAVQASIIEMLGQSRQLTALPAATKALESKNEQVRIAAIGAVGKIGQEAVLSDLFKVMRRNGDSEILAVRNALLIINGEGMTDKVAVALPKMPAKAQVALLSVLGERAANHRIHDVFSYTNHQNKEVRMAALTALGQVATNANLPQLFALLNETSQTDEITPIQTAILAAVHSHGTQPEQQALVLEQMAQSPAEKRSSYFNILAGIGGNDALKAVSEAFNTGDAGTKLLAISALASWADVSAANELHRISQQPANAQFLDQALKGYVRAVSSSAYAADQKLLLLRKGMDVASTTKQKQLILIEAEKTKTFPALVFAGRYLNDAVLKQEAAQAVMSIALSDKDMFSGDVVRNLLEEAIVVIEGPDSDYQKEAVRKFLAEMPQESGLTPLFNGKDMDGWKGLVANPLERAKMDKKTLELKQREADAKMRNSWKVENGELVFLGKGDNIATTRQYGDFEMFVDWKIFDDGHKKGDAGIYLRGSPQVQIWDTSRTDVGAQVGSGGLYNNKSHQSKPLKVADNPLGEWNTFRILMKGDRVTVYLNGELVTDNVILENYWNRELPIFAEEQIELQAHGSRVAYRDIYIREIPRPKAYELTAAEKKEGFKVLFDGTNMHHWQGNTKDYIIEEGDLVVHKPKFGSGGNLFTKEEYGDFIFRFEFKLTPGANNGLGLRAPLEGDAAYAGMELQILDNEAPIYKNLKEHQYHGSVYGVIPAKRGHLKPLGEWNYQEVIAKGTKIKVILNGITILDGDIAEASKNGTIDGKHHPGLLRDKGHIGFLGHGSTVWFRNIRIKDLSTTSKPLSKT